MDWWLAPIDPARAHEVGLAVSWHGRSMVLAWAVLAPLAVIVARYFKVLPGQDWPRELDNQIWWRSHWMGQTAVSVLSVLGFGLILSTSRTLGLHGVLGYLVLVLMAAQLGLGIFRGSKGGPTAPASDGSTRGDHYDMTPWRVMFEWVHKTLGYLTLILATIAVLLGMWEANAPRWMWAAILPWYAGLIILCLLFEKQGRTLDTYQAIWGPDPKHPGNQRKPIGWRVRRRDDVQPGE